MNDTLRLVDLVVSYFQEKQFIDVGGEFDKSLRDILGPSSEGDPESCFKTTPGTSTQETVPISGKGLNGTLSKNTGGGPGGTSTTKNGK